MNGGSGGGEEAGCYNGEVDDDWAASFDEGVIRWYGQYSLRLCAVRIVLQEYADPRLPINAEMTNPFLAVQISDLESMRSFYMI